MKLNSKLRRFLLASGSLSLLASSTLHAADFTWTGATDGNWGTSTNWDPAPTFNADNGIIFDSSTSNLATFIGDNRTIGSIRFTENADSNVSIRLNTAASGNTGRTLILGSSTVAPTITVDAGSTGDHTIGTVAANGVTTLANNLTINHNGSGILRMRGTNDGGNAFSLTKNGTGTLRFDNIFHSYTGGTTINGGILQFGSDPGSGIGYIRGTLNINSGGTVNAGSSWALGFNATATSYVNLINITGGTLNFSSTAGLGGTSANTINMTGGTIAGNGGGNTFDWFGHAGNGNTVALNTLASASQATISANLNLRLTSTGTLTFNTENGAASTDLLISGNVTTGGGSDGGGNIIKTGAGTMVMSGTNTYSGVTNVSAGTLALIGSGSIANSSSIIVGSDATLDVSATTTTWTVGATQSLSGTGTLAGNVIIAGNLNPGNSPGVITFEDNLTLNSTSLTNMEILGTARGSQYDGIDVGGDLVYGGALVFDLQTIFGIGTHTFNLFEVIGTKSGDFDTVALSGLYGSVGFMLNSGVWSASTNSGDQTWEFTQSSGNLVLTVIPEPGVALLGSLGLLCLLRRRR